MPGTGDVPHVLLVNPWVHDFAAYDAWAAPLGLLTLGGILRRHGYRLSYLDCLDRFHPRAAPADPRLRNGRGPYLKREIGKPPGLEDVPRRFSRYGVPPEWFAEDLARLPPPDLVLVTSVMTYRAPGVAETIAAIRRVHPGAPVLLGGIYATLLPDHAAGHAGADRVEAGPFEERILPAAGALTGWSSVPDFDPGSMDHRPYPAFDRQSRIPYVPLLTSRGCPYGCSYCASRLLDPERRLRSPLSVVEEIGYWHHAHGVRDFVFYDDALLVEAETHALPLFERLAAANMDIRFHTPNALHVREIDAGAAGLMRRAGFRTLRLGLETAVPEERRTLDGKVTLEEFERAVRHLKAAGFEKPRIGAYLLVGLPGQPLSRVMDSIDRVKAAGATPIPAYFTPIPGTAMWRPSLEASRYDLAADPVFTNNAVLPCRREPFSWDVITALKRRIAR